MPGATAKAKASEPASANKDRAAYALLEVDNGMNQLPSGQ